MWYINILNQRRYEETDEYLVVMFRMNDYFDEVLEQLETYDIGDLKIVSYDLPFSLKDDGYDTLLNLYEKPDLLRKLSEMEDSQYGLRFKELCQHFYNNNILQYIENYADIKWLNIASYHQLLNELIKANYISYRFVCRFFNFKQFFNQHQEFDKEVVESLDDDFLSLVYTRIKKGEYREYLKMDEVATYLKTVLNVLKTEVGFFVHEHHLYLLENSSGDREIYTRELREAIENENWFHVSNKTKQELTAS